MKPFFLIITALTSVTFSFGQIGVKPALDSLPVNTNTPVFPGFDKSAINRPSLSQKTNPAQVLQMPLEKHAGPENRWYIFERETDDFYWKNVKLDAIIIELDLGYSVQEKAIEDVLTAFGIDSLTGQSMHPTLQNFYAFKNPNPSKDFLLELGKALRQISYVKFMEPEPVQILTSCNPNDTYWVNQWGPYFILADSVWCFFTGGTKQWVGIIDDAIDWNHPDLYNTVWYGYDFYNNDNNPSPDYPTDQHGTHTTGTIGAEINNGIGIAGMLNDTVYAAKIVDNNGSLNLTAQINAINTIATIGKIRTYNMSFRGYTPNATVENAINNTWNNGKLPIAAAGNEATNTPAYPAAYANVIAVSAVGVDNSGNLTDASYSNYGNWINVSAPGGEIATGWPIQSTLPNNTYGGFEGTSMAAPHVTGVAAMIFAANPLLTNSQAKNILQAQTFDLGTTGYDQLFGNGMVCAICAYEEACNQFSAIITSNGTTICQGGYKLLNGPNNPNLLYQWRRNGTDIPGATTYQYQATQTGSYTLRITTLGNCMDISNNIVITVTPQAAANFSYSTIGNTVTFTNTSTNGTSYLWDFGDGNTSNQQNPVYTYNTPGTYTVTLTVSNTCGNNTTSQQVIIANTTSVEENIQETIAVSLFPNPASELLTVLFHTIHPTDIQYQVYDIAGRKILENALYNYSGEISVPLNIQDFSNGLYILELKAGNQLIRQKFTKE